MPRKPVPPSVIHGRKGWTVDGQGRVYDENGKERKGTPVKGGTSDAEGKSGSRGHLKVNVGDGKFVYLHRIVAAANGHSIEGKEVRHADDQKNGHNNRPGNLKTGSRQDNVDDRKRLRERMAKRIAKGSKK